MKIILEKEESINFDKINESHIIVGIISNLPCILLRESYEEGHYQFRPLNQFFTKGNNYQGKETIQEEIMHRLLQKEKVEVFKEKDWLKAMQWLNDNI